MFRVGSCERLEFLAAGNDGVHCRYIGCFKLKQFGDDNEAGEADISDRHVIAVAEDAGTRIAGKAGFHGG